MIEINLIPVHLRKKARGASEALVFLDLPKGFVLGCASLFIFIVIGVHLILFGIWYSKSTKFNETEAQWKGMIADKNSLDAINKQVKESSAKIGMVTNNVTKKMMLLSPKLNIISDTLPKGVWLTKISYANNVLTIEGHAFSKAHDEITTIGTFVSTLKKDTIFMKDFTSLELNSITRSKKNETEVADFSITAKGKEIFSATAPVKKGKQK